MKILIRLVCFTVLFLSGCAYLSMDSQIPSRPDDTQNQINEHATPKSSGETTSTPKAKISSDFKNAPDAKEISEETDKSISQVLLQDTNMYTIPMDGYFAICLEEDAQKAYRWMLLNEDEYFELAQETHLNGYRVFVFKPLNEGETSIIFELTQSSTLVETLSYQIIFS